MAEQNLRPDDGDRPTCRSRQHEPGTALPVATGLHICVACRDVLEETLIELPVLFDLCAAALDLRPSGLRERVSESRQHGIALCDAVMSVRSEIVRTLLAWSRFVTSERGVSVPGELSVRQLVSFLGIHLQWLCRHPAAPALVDELTALTTAVSTALRPRSYFREVVGTCLQPECEQTVYAEAHHEGAEPYEVACEAGHVWAPEHWLALRGKANGNGQEHVNGTSSRAPRPEKAE